ncbi:MAG: hypothetical protein RLZZ15_2721, partial [Verrucomicrobiota bacterium]
MMPKRLPRSLTLALLLLLATARVLPAAEPVRHTILFQNVPSGEQSVTESDGVAKVVYSYRDNGRGPDLNEEIRVGPDGAMLGYNVTGKSTFGAPVREKFTRRGDAVEWDSLADKGAKTVAGPAAYVPVENSFETLAVVARAVIRAPGMRLAALPAGELRAERLIESVTLTTAGRAADVSLYALTGLGTQPRFIWLTHDAALGFFAGLVPGSINVIAKGWEAQAPELEKLQVRADSDWLRRLAAALGHRLPDPILIRNVRVFDSREARLNPPADVYIARGKIAAIYETGSVPRDAATVFDGAGLTLLPGLYDMHGHEDPWNALLQIAGGVTSIRDLGNDNATLAELTARIDAGQSIGPRIHAAGFLEGESPFSSRGGIVVKSLDEAKNAVDWYAQHGFHQIKIYNSFRPEWVEATTAYAHRRGLRVSGHI